MTEKIFPGKFFFVVNYGFSFFREIPFYHFPLSDFLELQEKIYSRLSITRIKQHDILSREKKICSREGNIRVVEFVLYTTVYQKIFHGASEFVRRLGRKKDTYRVMIIFSFSIMNNFPALLALQCKVINYSLCSHFSSFFDSVFNFSFSLHHSVLPSFSFVCHVC